MSQEPSVPPTDDELAAWIRDHPSVWAAAPASEVDEADIERLVHKIASGQREANRVESMTRRRRRTAVGGVLSVVLIAGGAVGVAAIVRSQPSEPAAGIVCRAAAEPDADAFVIAAGADPIVGCTEVWETGSLVSGTRTAPPLTACISLPGAIEVYPGDTEVCASLGFPLADPTLSLDNQAVIALNDRLVDEINLAECATADQVFESAQQILDDSALDGWSVTIRADAADAACAKAAVDPSARLITITKYP